MTCTAETTGKKAIQRLTPPGKDAPLPLGGQNGSLDDAAWNSEQLIVSRVSALMYSCSLMLTSSYKCKVVRFLLLFFLSVGSFKMPLDFGFLLSKTPYCLFDVCYYATQSCLLTSE